MEELNEFEQKGWDAATAMIAESDNALPKAPKEHVLAKHNVKAENREDFLRGWSLCITADNEAQSKWDSFYSRRSQPKPKVRRVNAATARATTMIQRCRAAALRVAALEAEGEL